MTKLKTFKEALRLASGVSGGRPLSELQNIHGALTAFEHTFGKELTKQQRYQLSGAVTGVVNYIVNHREGERMTIKVKDRPRYSEKDTGVLRFS